MGCTLYIVSELGALPTIGPLMIGPLHFGYTIICLVLCVCLVLLCARLITYLSLSIGYTFLILLLGPSLLSTALYRIYTVGQHLLLAIYKKVHIIKSYCNNDHIYTS